METPATETEMLRDIGKEYEEKYGFRDPEKAVFKTRKGLDHAIIDQISDHKNEPDWMRKFRHQSLDIFFSKPMPTWGGEALKELDFENIYYYLKPVADKGRTWDD